MIRTEVRRLCDRYGNAYWRDLEPDRYPHDFVAELRFAPDHSDPDRSDGSGEVIDVTACGVCHSDLHVVDGEIPSPLPLILGHEVTGVHPRLGPVMVYAPWGCRTCELCAEGVEMICVDASEAGIFADGGYR